MAGEQQPLADAEMAVVRGERVGGAAQLGQGRGRRHSDGPDRPEVREERLEEGGAQVLDAARAAGTFLGADRPLDHLHVAIAPLLNPFVEVDEALADLRQVGARAVDLDQLLPGAPASPGWAASDRARAAPRHVVTVTHEEPDEGVPQARLGEPRGEPSGGRSAVVMGDHPGAAPAEHELELAELRRLETGGGVEPGAEREEGDRRHRLENVDLRHLHLEDGEKALESRIDRERQVVALERRAEVARTSWRKAA